MVVGVFSAGLRRLELEEMFRCVGGCRFRVRRSERALDFALVYFSIKKLCNANNAFEKKKGKRLK